METYKQNKKVYLMSLGTFSIKIPSQNVSLFGRNEGIYQVFLEF